MEPEIEPDEAEAGVECEGGREEALLSDLILPRVWPFPIILGQWKRGIVPLHHGIEIIYLATYKELERSSLGGQLWIKLCYVLLELKCDGLTGKRFGFLNQHTRLDGSVI